MKTGNRLVWIPVALLAVLVAMQGVIIAKLYRTEKVPAQIKKAPPVRMNLVPKAGSAPAAGWVTPKQPASPSGPPGGSGFDPDRWNPFEEFHRIRQRMDQLFNDSFGRFQMSPDFDSFFETAAFSPSMDVDEKNGNYVIRMDIPGADKSNISVDVSDRSLTVSGTVDESVEEQGQNQLRKERRSGRFSRSFTLPGPVKADEMEAEYDNGVLMITVPKAEEEGTTRRIEVK